MSHPSAGPTTTLPAIASKKGRGNGSDGEAVCRDGTDGQAVDQERARVVQEAFAFEDGQNAMRRSQRPENGGCGDGVGWRHDGPERNRRRPRHAWE